MFKSIQESKKITSASIKRNKLEFVLNSTKRQGKTNQPVYHKVEARFKSTIHD